MVTRAVSLLALAILAVAGALTSLSRLTGATVLHTRVMAYEVVDYGSADIHLLDLRRGQTLNLNRGSNWTDTSPAWSPDGARIAFASNRDGITGIYVMDVSGSDLHRVTASDESGLLPAWSPDGTRIAYTAVRQGGIGDIAVIDLNQPDQPPINLTNSDAFDSEATWSPDGSTIAFRSDADGSEDIWIMNADGSNPRNLTNSPETTETAPAWSPDGTRLAYAAKTGFQIRLYVVDLAADGAITQLTDFRFDNWRTLSRVRRIAWSPDGQAIAFQLDYDTNAYGIFVIDLADGRRQAVPDSRAIYRAPAWHPMH
jgi:TolB protein